jgi:prolyl oligopeptidase
MQDVMNPPPYSHVEPVTDVLHGVSIPDPYRWLEDQDSPRTKSWLEAQTQYARTYLDAIPHRPRILERVRELLAIETCDSPYKVGNRYFFRKRLPEREQPSIYMRESAEGVDVLLIDPSDRGTGSFTAVKPVQVSPDGRLLLYEVKEGGESTGRFELLDITSRMTLADFLPHGYLRGFAFAPDSRAFYYVHEPADAKRPIRWAAFRHVLGTPSCQDAEVFAAEGQGNLRLHIVPGDKYLGFLIYRFFETTHTEIYRWSFEGENAPAPIVKDARCGLSPVFVGDRILALTDQDAPNLRIVEIRPRDNLEHELVDLVPQTDSRISSWTIAEGRIFVSYWRNEKTEIRIFDTSGTRVGIVPTRECETVRLLGSPNPNQDEVFLETESFTEPVRIERCDARTGRLRVWSSRTIPFDSSRYGHARIWFSSKDGTRIPMFLVGRRDILEKGCQPVIMTSYGAYGISTTPQFSILVAFLLEHGCLFALPSIRGGSEFGARWHQAAQGRNRQVAFDDFLSAAEWLITRRRTIPEKLAIFGGSNSGLLVGAALTQRPDLFRAVICIAPLLDMLRYHLFEARHAWREEYGTVEDADDFAALAAYSPYHKVRAGVPYPAVMLVSGQVDRNCHPMHARKMTARLQAASSSGFPVLLDYSELRGHAPVMPLTKRISSLTDRLAFLCDRLRLAV